MLIRYPRTGHTKIFLIQKESLYLYSNYLGSLVVIRARENIHGELIFNAIFGSQPLQVSKRKNRPFYLTNYLSN